MTQRHRQVHCLVPVMITHVSFEFEALKSGFEGVFDNDATSHGVGKSQ